MEQIGRARIASTTAVRGGRRLIEPLQSEHGHFPGVLMPFGAYLGHRGGKPVLEDEVSDPAVGSLVCGAGPQAQRQDVAHRGGPEPDDSLGDIGGEDAGLGHGRVGDAQDGHR